MTSMSKQYECFGGPLDGQEKFGNGEINSIMMQVKEDGSEYYFYRLVQACATEARPPMYYQYEGVDAEALMARMREENPHVFDDDAQEDVENN